MATTVTPYQDAPKRSPWKSSVFRSVGWTIGAETGGNTINVAGQLQDDRGHSIAQLAEVLLYLSDSADGHTITATATTSALAIGTNGTLLSIPVTGKMAQVLCDALGRFDLNIIQTAAAQLYYLAAICPDGSITVSPAVQFA